MMLRSSFYVCVLMLFVLIWPGQVLAQSAGPVSLGSGAEQDADSCSLLLQPGDTDDFLRLMAPIGYPAPVKVNIAFQIGDHTPCYVDRITPTELHFPRSNFSIKVEPQDKQSRYRYILNRTGIGPVIWFAEVGGICVTVDEAWKYEISCEGLTY